MIAITTRYWVEICNYLEDDILELGDCGDQLALDTKNRQVLGVEYIP